MDFQVVETDALRRAIKDALSKSGADSATVRMSMDELDGGAAWSRKQETAEPPELELLALRRVEFLVDMYKILCGSVF